MTSLRLTGKSLQDRPDPKAAILLLRGVSQYLTGSKRRRYLVFSNHVTQGNRVRGRGNPCGIHPLQYLEVLQYVGKLLAEFLQVSLINTQPGKKGDVLHFLSA